MTPLPIIFIVNRGRPPFPAWWTPSYGQPFALSVTVPPLAMVVFKRGLTDSRPLFESFKAEVDAADGKPLRASMLTNIFLLAG